MSRTRDRCIWGWRAKRGGKEGRKEVELTRFGGHLSVSDTEVFSEAIGRKTRDGAARTANV